MSALSPTIELGAQWPPLGISAINPFELPLLNTVILLSSGVHQKWNNCEMKLNPHYVTGFVDAEGSFTISINQSLKYKAGWISAVKPIFKIELHGGDIALLKQI